MALRRLAKAFTLIATFTVLGLTACNEDEEEEHAEDDHAHEPMSTSCVELSEVCHEADTGTGPAHDCHEIAHDDDEDTCAAALVDCMTACM